MNKQDYAVSITVNATAQEVFDSINSVSKWWTKDFEGISEKLNDEFTVSFGETWIKIKIVEFVPNKKIVWDVIDCYKHWLKDKKEWKGTTISWEIATERNATQINFIHFDLVPGKECYNGCEKAWDQYIKGSLFKLLSKENGVPS